MKTALFKFVVIGFILTQTDILPQEFFPLNLGNKYQFEDVWEWSGPGGTGGYGIDYYRSSVFKDTLIDGKRYFAFSPYWKYWNSPIIDGAFFHYDSSENKVFIKLRYDNTVRLAVDFNVPKDSSYDSWILGEKKLFISDGIYTDEVFGDSVRVYSLKRDYTISPFYRVTYYFAEGIGLYKYYRIDTNGGNSASVSNQALLTAIIDSVVVNPLVLQIDSLYPVIDRPIDTFPFLLTADFQASYNALIDSFYLTVDHLREDSLVNQYYFELEPWDPYISLYFSDLLVGDKLNLQAVITDTSIHNNRYVYPDIGKITINILPPLTGLDQINKPFSFKLEQNFPNPFNPVTTIMFSLPSDANVNLSVFNLIGEEVAEIINSDLPAGSHKINFDASDLTSGVYLYRLNASAEDGTVFTDTKKFTLIK
ncbi:MAG: hypothetical protein Kow0098_02920 [Ignavibacteriaceae bacterium]